MAYRSLLRTGAAGLIGLSAALLSTSCDNGNGDPAPNGEREVELRFDVKIGSEKVECGRPLAALGENKRVTELKDMRFFVHDVQLLDAKGKTVALELPDDGLWQFKNVALLDFEDRSGACDNGTSDTNAVVRGKVPAGDYTGVSFRIGVPAKLAHSDPGTHKSPLTGSGLYWGWLQGFILFKLDFEMAEKGAEQAGAYEVHLGSNTCTNNAGKFSCARENMPRVELGSFDIEKDKVVLDLAALLASAELTRRDGDTNVPGCASGANDPDCEPIFAAFGLDLESGEPSGDQSIFSVRAREADDPGRSPQPDAGVVEEREGGTQADAAAYQVELPATGGLQQPLVPAENPLSAEKVELGRHLFYDKRLSGNQTQSCASCHKQELAFTDGLAVGKGSTNESHIRGSMSLANVAYSPTLTWAHPTMKTLEDQAHVPMFGTEPVELGLNGMDDELLRRLRAEAKYQRLFPAAFPDQTDPFNILNVKRAIASFERTLVSGSSPYDYYVAGDANAISESAKRGMDLFFDPDPSGSAVECFHCHGGPTFTDQLTHVNQPSGAEPFHNTGLYNIGTDYNYPAGNQGLFEFTNRAGDKGRFKAPTLRNIAVTAPYMHDGSIATLEEVIAHYARGGRNVESGPNVGDGALNRRKSEFIHGFPGITAQQRADLIEFLKSLTDQEFLTNPKYANPWP